MVGQLEANIIQAGIVGATGYTGYELAVILSRHPRTQVVFATSEANAGQSLDALYPAGPALPLIAQDDAPIDRVDVVFTCLPHGAAAPVVLRALEAGSRVVDLSADFRLRSADEYAKWYGKPHPAPEWLSKAVYGLVEFARPLLPDAQLVANPGCYPTGVLLALQPILSAGGVAAEALGGAIVADCKSGVSGAGRTPKQHTHFVEVADNFSPYNIGRAHRHLPEIEQGLRAWRRDPPTLVFSPDRKSVV